MGCLTSPVMCEGVLVAGSYADEHGLMLRTPRQALFMSSFDTAERSPLPSQFSPPWRSSIHSPTFSSPPLSRLGFGGADPHSLPGQATALSAAQFGW